MLLYWYLDTGVNLTKGNQKVLLYWYLDTGVNLTKGYQKALLYWNLDTGFVNLTTLVGLLNATTAG